VTVPALSVSGTLAESVAQLDARDLPALVRART